MYINNIINDTIAYSISESECHVCASVIFLFTINHHTKYTRAHSNKNINNNKAKKLLLLLCIYDIIIIVAAGSGA